MTYLRRSLGPGGLLLLRLKSGRFQWLSLRQGDSQPSDTTSSSPAGATGSSSTGRTTPEPSEPTAASPSGQGKRKRDDEGGASSRKKAKPSAGPSRGATTGLCNPGNWCYMNSGVQILANCDPLAVHLSEKRSDALDLSQLPWASKLDARPSRDEDPPMVAAVTHFMENGVTFSAEFGLLAAEMRGADEPKAVLGCGRVKAASAVRSLLNDGDQWFTEEQEDAGEWLSFALAQLRQEEEATGVVTKVDEVFGGKWKFAERCAACGATCAKEEAFAELQLSLPGLDGTRRQALRVGRRAESLRQLIAAVCDDGGVLRTCRKCDQRKAQRISANFSEPPEKLLLMVGRTQLDYSTALQYKNGTPPEGPFDRLPLPLPADQGEVHYSLEAMAEHRGR